MRTILSSIILLTLLGPTGCAGATPSPSASASTPHPPSSGTTTTAADAALPPTPVATPTLVATAAPSATAVMPTTSPHPTVAPTATPTPAAPLSARSAASPGADTIEIPAPGERVTIPLHVLAHVGAAGEAVTVVVRWQDGTTLRRMYTALAAPNGGGLVIANADWGPLPQPPRPPSQPATLDILDARGHPLAQQAITVLAGDDPNVQDVLVYWVAGDPQNPSVLPMHVQVPRTPRVASAALDELLWGPPAPTQIGYTTALPTPEQVLTFPGRQPDWGSRVTLRGLTITDGVAAADFSRELRAYGGGSLRVRLIREQIGRTLRQFPTVRQVNIAIEGKTEGVLEP